MTKALFLETSTEEGLIALLEGPELVEEQALPFGFQNSRALVPRLDLLLRRHRLELEELSYLAVGVGPGSYTGIRVSAAVAKILSFACSLPLVGICSLKAFLPREEGPFAALFDARVGGVYALLGARGKEGISYGAPRIIPPEGWQELASSASLFVSPHASRLRPKFESRGIFSAWQEAGPSAEQIAKEAYALFLEGKASMEGELQLLYLRKTEAEARRDALKSCSFEKE